MKIAVIGAHGKSGSKIVDEARRRGHDVTAIVRRDAGTNADHRLVKDVFGLEKADLAGFDVVVNALGFPGQRTTRCIPPPSSTSSISLQAVRLASLSLAVRAASSWTIRAPPSTTPPASPKLSR